MSDIMASYNRIVVWDAEAAPYNPFRDWIGWDRAQQGALLLGYRSPRRYTTRRNVRKGMLTWEDEGMRGALRERTWLIHID